MNKMWILFHLKEALDQIENTIKGIENEPEYGETDFSIEMNHLYHHLNTAWNSRNSSENETNEDSEKFFKKWRQFPIDMS